MSKLITIREIFGDFIGNLGNCFYNDGEKIVMLEKDDKRNNIKDPYCTAARPMIHKERCFGYESVFFTTAKVAEEFEDQNVLVQFHDSASCWINGVLKKKDSVGNDLYERHKKLDRAARIMVKNPTLCAVEKEDKQVHKWEETDPDTGLNRRRQKTVKTKYLQYFLRVTEEWQVTEYVSEYRNVNLVELHKMLES